MRGLRREAKVGAERAEGSVVVWEKRARNCVSPALGDIIEEDEENINNENYTDQIEEDCPSKVSFREPSTHWKLEETPRKPENHQYRASSGLIFLLTIAALVTTFFLLSPVLETVFSKYA
jgi:hypothetical protein